jgi:MFS transporter, DHA2 family, methylenomycin A resistance protein
MARNIGTAFGVAVLSQVYLLHMNTTLPSTLTASRAAADQFVVSGEGAGRVMIEAVILQGFKLTALTCLVLCGGAAVLAFFIRTHLRKKGITYPVQEECEIARTSSELFGDDKKHKRCCLSSHNSKGDPITCGIDGQMHLEQR